MAILFADNFEGFGADTSLMLNGLYSEINAISLVADPDPNATGTVILSSRGGDNSDTNLRRPFAKGPVPTVGAAFRLWLQQLPANNDANTHHMEFRDAANNALGYFAVLSTGALRFSVVGGADYDTPAPILTANAWSHIEVKYSHGGGAIVSFEVRVEGVSVLSQANVAGTNADIGQIAIYRHNINGDAGNYVKDLVVWDASGQYDNDFLGTVSVVSMVPDSDVALGWTPSTGTTGYNLLNQSPPIDNADFLTAPYPPPPPSSFSLTDLPVNVSVVKALISQVRARKVDGGDGDIQVGMLSNGAEVDGANRPITTAFTYYEDVFEIDPATNARWTPASTDAAEIKINRTL